MAHYIYYSYADLPHNILLVCSSTTLCPAATKHPFFEIEIEATHDKHTMPAKSAFVLKDSPEDVKTSNPNVTPKGRTYNGDIAKTKRGATKINEILLGTKLACIAITDDKRDTLKEVSKLNPWHEVAVTTITGSKEEAHKPLSSILDRHFGLKLDHHIDISKRAGGYRTVDTQGYIAHNDEIIVVSFRCTTSAFDWMTNLDISSSEWGKWYFTSFAAACVMHAQNYHLNFLCCTSILNALSLKIQNWKRILPRDIVGIAAVLMEGLVTGLVEGKESPGFILDFTTIYYRSYPY